MVPSSYVNIQAYTETWGVYGSYEDAYCYFDAWHRDYQTWDYVSEYNGGYISVYDHISCAATLDAFFEDVALSCDPLA